MGDQKRFGITGTISTALPDEKDLRLNESLIQELKAQNNYAPREETDKR